MKTSLARGPRLSFWSVNLMATLLVLMLSPAMSRAEFYFGGAIGGNFPLDFSDVELNAINNPPVDLQLENSLAYGGKAGYFFPSLKWLGDRTRSLQYQPKH